MEGENRSEQNGEYPQDSILVYEAIAMTKKLGLSVKKDQEKVVNVCIELLALKLEIENLRKMLGIKQVRISSLEKKLKESGLLAEADVGGNEMEQIESEEKALNVTKGSQFTQTDIIESIAKGTMTDNDTVEQTDQSTMTLDDALKYRDASAMTDSCLIKHRDQSTATEEELTNAKVAPILTNSFMQTERARTSATGTQTIDDHDQYNSHKDPIVSHTMNTIKYACSMIEHSLNFQKVLHKASSATQTDEESTTDPWEECNGSAECSSKLPPIVRGYSSKAQRTAGSNKNSHYHKQCIPPKRRGKTWIF